MSRDPIGEEGGGNLYGFAGNDGENQSDVLGMWFADGSAVKEDHSVVLDGRGGIRPGMKGGSNKWQKLHEQTHVVQFQGGKDPRTNVADDEKIVVGPVKRWHAIPYKQLFRCCVDSGGDVKLDGTGTPKWCYPKNRGTILSPNFENTIQQRAETDFWDDGSSVFPHYYAELSALEIPVSLWQMRRDNNKSLRQALARNLQYYQANKNDKVPAPAWVKYKEFIDEAKKLYAIHGLEWKWKLPDHVYKEFLP